jgi:MoaA/NifB/PqqE/SkfB family radical SAM enzyme
MSNLRTLNLKQNERDYTERRLALSSRPTYVLVELTQNCNLACKMCRAAQGYNPDLDMSEELFELVAKELFPYASMVDLRGWGESTILKSFPGRLTRTINSGARVRLVTNGMAMTERLWELFFQRDNVIGISFDSSTPEMFSELGRGDFHRVVRNLRKGVDIRNRNGHGSIYLLTVLNSYTLAELPDILRLAADIKLDKVVINPIKCPPSHKAHLSHAVDKIPGVLNEAQQVALTLGIKLQLGSALETAVAVSYGLPSTCSNPWSHALIDYQGRVGFCDHLINNPQVTLGSLKESTFDNIWNGEKFQQLRAEHVAAQEKRELSTKFRKCTWCYSNRYGETDLLPIGAVDVREVSTSTGLPLYQLKKC